MYTFRKETDLNAFEQFVLANGGWYLQSAKWADVKKDWNHYFYAGFEGDTRVLTALVLERALPGVGKIWYSPAGAVCDPQNAELIKEYASFILAEMKKAGATALFYDPCVALRINGEKQPSGVQAHKNLCDAGFRLNADASRCLYKAPVQLLSAPLSARKAAQKLRKGRALFRACGREPRPDRTGIHRRRYREGSAYP